MRATRDRVERQAEVTTGWQHATVFRAYNRGERVWALYVGGTRKGFTLTPAMNWRYTLTSGARCWLWASTLQEMMENLREER